MSGPRNMHAHRDVRQYSFTYSDKEAVSSNPNNNGLKRIVW